MNVRYPYCVTFEGSSSAPLVLCFNLTRREETVITTVVHRIPHSSRGAIFATNATVGLIPTNSDTIPAKEGDVKLARQSSVALNHITLHYFAPTAITISTTIPACHSTVARVCALRGFDAGFPAKSSNPTRKSHIAATGVNTGIVKNTSTSAPTNVLSSQ